MHQESLIYSIPFLASLVFIAIKYMFFYEDENINDIIVELIFLSIVNYSAFYIIYENLKVKQIKEIKINPSNSIITGPPKFFPYQRT